MKLRHDKSIVLLREKGWYIDDVIDIEPEGQYKLARLDSENEI